MKDGIPLIPNNRVQQEVIPDPLGGGALSCRLIIGKPVSSDSGHYICRAESNTWSDHISADVIFKGIHVKIVICIANLFMASKNCTIFRI
jgi:hypothetical protein